MNPARWNQARSHHGARRTAIGVGAIVVGCLTWYAPNAVLAGVPGITEEILQQILSSREPEVTDLSVVVVDAAGMLEPVLGERFAMLDFV